MREFRPRIRSGGLGLAHGRGVGRQVGRERILFLSATGWLVGPSRSLATVLFYCQDRWKCVLAAPPGELADLVRGQGTADEFLRLHRNPRWRKSSRVAASIVASTWLIRHRRIVRAVHANGLSELNAIGPGALVTRVPVIVWNHSSAASPIAGRMARIWRRLLSSVRWAAVSESARSALALATGLSPNDVQIIANPVDLPDESNNSVRPLSSPVRVAYLSEPTEMKGFSVLVEAARLLEREEIEWRLYTRIVEGSSASELISPLGKVRVCGRTQNVASAYKQSDIVFVPSLRESFGRVAAEAMACGLPVVASDIPSLRSLVGDDVAGLLFRPNDPQAAARAVAALASDATRRQAMGTAERIRARRFDPRQIIPQLEALYTGA